MKHVSIQHIDLGSAFSLGSYVLSEADIIQFAENYDPLPFHVDIDAAQQSHFKGLVASGPHIFTIAHRNGWIPQFGHSVLAGLEVNNWKFLAPTRPGVTISGSVVVKKLSKNQEKGHAVIVWHYEFTDNNNTLLQSLEVTVLHKLD